MYQGTIDLRQSNPNLPRQKVNGLFQYKQSKHIIAVLSYGYAVTVTIEETGKEDVIMSRLSANHLESDDLHKAPPR